VIQEFPVEKKIELEGQDFLEGQLVIHRYEKQGNFLYSVETNLVLKESKKIYRSVAQSFDHDNFLEAQELGVQKLADFFRKLKMPVK